MDPAGGMSMRGVIVTAACIFFSIYGGQLSRLTTLDKCNSDYTLFAKASTPLLGGQTAPQES